MMSAADAEISKHTVEGEAFIRGRAAFREEYADGSSKDRPAKGFLSRDRVCSSKSNNFLRMQRPILHFPLGANFDPRGQVVPQG
jgi:hypothetical protein